MSFYARAQGKSRRLAASTLFRRTVRLRNSTPLISFTFDDFPKSAFRFGGEILKSHGVWGTYYAALGLMSQQAPAGEMFSAEDLVDLVTDGHELGCHTYGHCHAWDTTPETFEQSIIQNKSSLAMTLPKVSMKTMSYPIDSPRPRTKARAGRHYLCCRGGGQRPNIGDIDLNFLNAFFLEKSGGDFAMIERALEKNAAAGGWLIFATHDVTDSPSPYGCTPAYFEKAVAAAKGTGATIATVSEACERILRSQS